MKTSKMKWLLSSLLAIAAFFGFAAEVSSTDAAHAVRAWVAMGKPLGADIGSQVVSSETIETNGVMFHAVSLDRGMVFTSANTESEPIVAFTSATNFDNSAQNPLFMLLRRDAEVRARAAAAGLTTGAKNINRSTSSSKKADSTAPALWDSLINMGTKLESGEMSVADVKATASADPRQTISDVRVAPLLSTKWDQLTHNGDAPTSWGSSFNGQNCYNYYTPNVYYYYVENGMIVQPGSKYKLNAYCGCSATGLAQLLKYWEFPKTSVARVTRRCTVKDIYKSGSTWYQYSYATNMTTRGGTYEWSKMTATPESSSMTDANRAAIGKLTYDCAVALVSEFSARGTGASPDNQILALTEVFGYANAKYCFDSTLVGQNTLGTTEAWHHGAFYAPFDAGTPVLLAIYEVSYGNIEAGHCVVGDGYGYHTVSGVKTPFVHLNMGWSGTDDVWYNIPNIDTEGAGYDNGHYNVFGGVIYNVFPTNTGEIVSGRVLNASGNPVSGATVKICQNGSKTVIATKTSSSSGVFAFIVPSGKKYDLTATTSGGYSGTLTTAVIPASVTTDWGSGNTIGNSWGNDITLVAPAAKPDLVVGSGFLSASASDNSSHAATSFEVGKPIYVHYSVKNQGGGASSGSFVVQHEVDGVANTYSETITSSLASGASLPVQTLQPSFLQNLPKGSYVYRCNIDYLDSISESNEGNNSLAIPFTVSEPIIIPTNLTISGSSSLESGEKGAYVAVATMSDGNKRVVTPIWSISSGFSYAEVDEDGIVTAGVLTEPHNAILRASYTLNGVTVTGSKAISITAALPLPVALDTSLSFTTGGSRPWYGQSRISYDGIDAARSGPISDGQVSWMKTSVVGPGTISFVWQVSTEARCDVFRFYIDGVEVIADSGDNSAMNIWRTDDAIIPAGTHELKWEYSKDVSEAEGYDAVVVDQIRWISSPTLASIAINGSDSVVAGQTAKYTCQATWSDGSSKTVSPAWSIVEGEPYATISSNGVLNAAVTTIGRTVTIKAEYAEDGILKEATNAVSIIAIEPPPEAPVITSAGAGNANAANLEWSAAAYAVSYNIYRSATSSKPSVALATGISALAYSDASTQPGVEYWYWVEAVNSKGTAVSEGKVAYRIASASTTPDSLAAAYDGDTFNVEVKANAEWTVSVSAAAEGWLTTSTSSGSGDGVLSASATANDTGTERVGWILVTAAPGTAHPVTCRVLVTQAGMPNVRPDFGFSLIAGGDPELVMYAASASNGSAEKLIDFGQEFYVRFGWNNHGDGSNLGSVVNTVWFEDIDGVAVMSKSQTYDKEIKPGTVMAESYSSADWSELLPGPYVAKVKLNSATMLIDKTSPYTEDDMTDNEAEYRFAIRDAVSLNEALDCDSIAFSTSDDAWFGSNGIGLDGDDGVMTKYLGDGGENVLTGTFSGAGTLEFFYRVSSEAHDSFLFEVDGQRVVSVSGVGDWRVCTCIVGEGDHVATWTYAKDATLSEGADCVFIDSVVWMPESHEPPTDVVATDGESTANVRVSWTKCEGALSYEVGRAESEDSETVEVLGSTSLNSFPDTTGVGGVRYWYCVRAIFPNGVSDWSLRDEGWRLVTLRISGGSAKTVPSAAGASSFSIAGNAAWTAVSDSAWLTLGLSEGVGDMKVPFRYDENTSSDERTAIVTITDVAGSETRTVKVTQSAAVKVGSLVSLNAAADNAILRFSTSGAAAWFGQTFISHDGVDALRSGGIPHDTNTILSTTLDRGGELSFWWGSCCHSLDKLNLYVGGELVDSISGYSLTGGGKTNVLNWTYVTVEVPDGGAVVKWEYLKNKTTASGEDAVFIDQITWSPSGISGHPFDDPDKRDGTPTVFDDLSVTLFDVPAASGDCVAVFDRATDKLLTVQRVEAEGLIPIFAINGLKANDKLYFKVWNAASGLASPEIFTSAASDDLVIANPDDSIVGFNVNITGTKPTYTVSYDLAGKATRTGGGELTQSVAFGEEAADPELSVNEGWLFAGWDRSERTDVRCSMSITALYEKMPPKTYTVTYDPGANGTGSQQTDTKTEDVALTLKGALFTRDGYTQTGWATSDGGAKAYGLGASYTANEPVTLYPFWTEYLDPATIRIDTEDSYETEPDGSFELNLGELIRSASTPTVTVKGLPAGIKFDNKKVVIAGQATKPSVSTVTVSVKNQKVKTPVTATFELVVPNLRCGVLPNLDPAPDAYGVVMCGVAFDPGLVDCSTSESGWTVKVAGLPTGLKYDTKTGTITGVPTKAGTFTVTFTATKKGQANQVATITLSTEALPTWATGTFTGNVKYGDDYGPATMTVAANGKVSGKVSLGGTNWTFSAASYSSMEETPDTTFVVEADAKAGKVTMPVLLSVVECDAPATLINSSVSGEFGDGTIELWRNVWKDKASAAAAKAEIAKWEGVYTISIEDGGYFSLTVGKTGDVKASGKLSDGTSVSVTAPLMYHFSKDFFTVFCVSPSAYKGGFVFLPVGFGSERGELVNIGDPLIWSSRNPQATDEYGAGFLRSNNFIGAYYDKLKKLNAYYNSLRFGMDASPELSYTFKLTCQNAAGKKATESMPAQTPAVDTLWQDGLTATVDGKGAFVVARATKPVQNTTTKEWSYDGVNDGALTLSFTQATGLFKGSYTFWFDYVSAHDETTGKSTKAHTSKKVSFEGVFVQGTDALSGFYLWDATGEYTDAKTKKLKTYKYKETFSVYLQP